MKAITLTDKLRKAQNELAKAQAQREAGFKAIVRADVKIKDAERTIARLQRRLKLQGLLRSKSPWDEQPAAVPVETLKPIKPENIPPAESSLDIPEALRRTPPNLADEVAKAEIQAALNTNKQAKTKGRIAKMLANKSGARQNMPLAGKAAVDYIKNREG